MSYNEMNPQLLNCAEPLTVTYAYSNPSLRRVWFQVNRTPEEVAECVLALRLLYGFRSDFFSLERTGNESLVGLEISETHPEFPELFGRTAQLLATYLGTPYYLTFLFKDMHPSTNPMRLPAFALQFGLSELYEDLHMDSDTALIDELEASFTESASMGSSDN